ncbi:MULTISPECIES: TetR/AcrR family transcriptional regulator [Pseudoxanthomonas]|uniref:TetR/AcrR family transcriptional repressor of nem operon n=1 Tax=Pseudoxanthomonas winnipegensis TaxID=2480810 RepID=A0AAW8GCS1_9GAMM|nr:MULTISPECIES: TetR/AcrR family transcriptional regulator [Pseudoxanthomonas]MDQ1119040.1 TetR/AcrR family transcriptional repressor of nem operon [Pseudoxanthomonas winnipegensis]MDQ1132228.1 TetR/AcrR family transcriptional repressor of nem operon [Pseudoxanthomonas winnipegensis]MDR6137757.1 TetR/AcrR family transcriptional repressor of nem operon [Pseudoxanthomonas sp. SORGH_AS_0997]
MTNRASSTTRRPMGRPRSFDLEAAVARAVPVFREHGYDGTSIDHLKQATGLTAGSLYKAFKDKRQVFSAAFSYYLEHRRQELALRLEGALNGRERIAEILRFYLESASGAEGRRGCLVLASLIEATTLDDPLRDALIKSLDENRSALVATLREGQRDGSIRGDLAVEPCADLLLGLLQGLRALGKLHDPAHHAELITTALKMLD